MNLGRLFIKKTVQRIQEESQSSTLKRSLGRWNLVSLGIGCIIGAGIFVMTGTAAAHHAGPAIVLSFVIAGIACAFAGLCYAELASVLPVSGSAYTYAYATLGEVFAWTMGWLLVLEYGISSSAVAVGWSGYVVSFLKDLDILIPAHLTAPPGVMVALLDGTSVEGVFNLPAFIGIMMVTILLIIGVSESAKVNNVIVAMKLAVIVAFICIGVFYIEPTNWQPFIPENTGVDGEYGVSGILRGASIIFFAYIGFEAVSTAAQEAKDPQKDMAFGIIGSLLICTVLYMMVSAVLTGVSHYSTLGVADPMAVAVDTIGLGWFATIIKIGAITGLTSVMLVLVYGQTRIFYTMSRDGLLPMAFCKVHPKYHTPYLNTAIVGIVIAFAAALTPIQQLGDLTSLGTLAAFVIVCMSTIYLRVKEPGLHRPYKVPFYPFTPILGVLSCGYLIAQLPMSTFIQLKLFFLLGAVIYLVYGLRKSRLALEMRPRKGDETFVKAEHERRTD